MEGGSETLGWPHRRIISGRGPEKLGNRSEFLSLFTTDGLISQRDNRDVADGHPETLNTEAFFMLDEVFSEGSNFVICVNF